MTLNLEEIGSSFVEIAQMVERSLYTAEATGSMPVLDIPLFLKWSKNYSAAHSDYNIKNTFTFIKYSSQKE